MGDHRTAVNDVVSSLADSIVSHAITLVMLLPVMKLAYEKNSHVAGFRHDEEVLDFVRPPTLSRPSSSRNGSSL